jgi:peptidoglycan/LPS O-acetylase OafA/YrhL
MERVREFDGIRGLAALSVMVFHLADRPSYEFINNSWSFPFSFPLGAYGVETFFMLSGFVIFLSLENQKSIISFCKSRFIRLFPIFWVCVFLSTALILVFHLNVKISVPILLANLTMIQRQFVGVSSNIEGSYWTLECELWFYVIVSLIYFKIGKKYVIYAYVFLATVGLIVHSFGIIHQADNWHWLMRSIFMRFYGILNIKFANLFLAGISLYLYRESKQKLYCFTFIFAILCSFAYTSGLIVSSIASGLTVSSIGLLLWFSNLPLLRSILCNRILLFLGGISYPLYLIHMNLGRLIVATVSNSTYSTSLGLFAGITCIIVASTFLTFKVDIPLRKYLQKRLP